MAAAIQVPSTPHGVTCRHEQIGERHVFVVCNGECCRKAGAPQLLRLLKEHCATLVHGKDVRISASRECIGHCSAAPAMVEDGRILRWVSLSRLKGELLRLGLI